MKLTFKKLDPRAVIPSRATAGSAGLDLCACLDEPVTLAPGEIKMIPIGITAQPDSDDIALLIYPRSGLSSKFGVSLANCVGVVDSDYRGEIMVALHNHSERAQSIDDGERIAQMVITPYLTAEFIETDELDDTERGAGGFGSTGRK